MSRKILVLLVAMFVFVVMVFTMGPGFAQDRVIEAKVIEAKAGGAVTRAPGEPGSAKDDLRPPPAPKAAPAPPPAPAPK